MIELDSLFNDDSDFLPQFNIRSNEDFITEYKTIVKTNNELRSDLMKSTEGVVGDFLSKIIKIIGKIIAFIGKCIVWITKTIINKIASFIAWITRKKDSRPEQGKGILNKLKAAWNSKEDQNNDTMQGVNALAADIKSYIKSPDDIKNMKPEELVFYKVFLISVSLDDTKYLIDLFNRQTSILKENGDKIDKKGQSLVTLAQLDNKNNKSSNEDWLLSTEDDQSNNVVKFPKMTDDIVKNNKFKSTDTNKDYENIINSIYRSIYEKPDDSLWLNKLKIIFSNGSKELTEISKSMKIKQNYLEKLSKEGNISDKLKKSVSDYSRDVTSFQSSIMSYINCINYFAKYQNIRMNLVRRFNNLAQVYRQSA